MGRFHQARGLKLLAELRATLERLPVEERERKEEELREEIVAEYGRAVELAGAAQDVSIARQYVDSMRSRNRLVAARRLVAEADAARRLGDARKALDLYEEAVRLDDRNIDALFAKGILELGAGDLETAARSLDAVLALNSDHLGALFHVAQIHHVKRRTPDAKRALERFLERAEPHAEELSAEIREARALLEQLASEPSEGR